MWNLDTEYHQSIISNNLAWIFYKHTHIYIYIYGGQNRTASSYSLNVYNTRNSVITTLDLIRRRCAFTTIAAIHYLDLQTGGRQAAWPHSSSNLSTVKRVIARSQQPPRQWLSHCKPSMLENNVIKVQLPQACYQESSTRKQQLHECYAYLYICAHTVYTNWKWCYLILM